MRCAWAALLVAGSVLVGLRLGRPLYYTDGTSRIDAQALAEASMLRWRTPEAIAEVPGPIAGRLAQLPDGRLLYGRLQAAGHADLVLWDPARPAIPPEPLVGCNTMANELAPQLAADGSLLFASDRDGGVGGYDLYRAPSPWARATDVQPLAACNTALDDTDPALHGNGVDLVFVRSDRRIDGGNDGVLWRWRLGDALDPVPVWSPGRAGQRGIDRDPAFAADGASLWFVRKLPGRPLALQRASWMAGALDQPTEPGRHWGTGELRSPIAPADGQQLLLLQARQEGAAALLFRATAQPLVPWWPGQRWLEWILLGVVATSLLVLLLLHFGRRWSALDLVAQCLLLSLLLHVLLFLWLMGVEIAGALLPGDDAGGGFEVDVRTEAVAAAAGGGADSVVAAEVAFPQRERDLQAAAPATAAVRDPAAQQLAAPDGALPSEPVPQPVSAAAEVADAAAPVEVRQGADAAAAVAPANVPAVDRSAAAAAAAAQGARSHSERDAVAVMAPASGLSLGARASAALAAPAQRRDAAEAEPRGELPAPAAPALLDAPAAAAAGAPVAASDAAPAAPWPAAHAIAAAPAPAAAPTAARAAAAMPSDDLAPGTPAPGGALARARFAARNAPAAQRAAAEPGTGLAAVAPAATLRDAPVAVAPAPGTAAADRPTAAPAPAVPRPSLAPSAAPAAPAAIAAARSAPAGPAAAATPDVPQPTSRLVRPSGPLPASSLVPSPHSAPAARGSAVVAAPTLRDPAAAPARPGPGMAAASPAGPRPLAAATALPGPAAAGMDRPARAATVGAAPSREFALTPPASVLPRGPVAVAAGAALAPVATGSTYSNRFGPAKARAIERFGGSETTERAVTNGLRYLARIQHPDGAWGDREEYDGKYGFVHVGKTALCLLAFLGAGHTPTSASEHSDTAARALAYLLAVQEPDSGAFGPSSCYGHGIATYALAECYGLTKQPELLRPLERALTWIVEHQGPRRDRRNRGGWGYFSPGLRPEDDYARVSVTAWMVMALESARLSGVELPTDVLPAAREYLELAYDQPNGWFRYNHKPSRVNSSWPTLPASTPAAAFCLLLLGGRPDDERVRAAVQFTAERRPERYRRYRDDDFVLRGQGNVYFWYYGTLCCFLAGGEAWDRWNERLRTVLPQAQQRDGSFLPIDVYAEEAGDSATDRSYTTAMCVLCLEVYYRYFTPLLSGR